MVRHLARLGQLACELQRKRAARSVGKEAVLFWRKEPKDFCSCACGKVEAMTDMLGIASTAKSLLVLFFRKELLPS